MARPIERRAPLGRLRLAIPEDASHIMPLVTDAMIHNFRVRNPSDIAYLIKHSILAICQLDQNKEIVGFAAAKDYPQIPSVNPAAWEDFVWMKYKTTEMNARNTLFLHLLCWNPAYARDVVDAMLRSLFMHDFYVQCVAMMKIPSEYPALVPGQSRAEVSFKRIQAIERGVPGDQLPSLMVVERNDVCLKLKVRRAVEEDNDDIVPIIDRQSEKLRQLYGDYYMSELISRHPDSERVLLVCEHKEVAVGVMCLNTQINYEELEESFDLTPFAGLKRLEKITPPTPVGLEESSSSILLDDKTEEPRKEHSQISVSKSIKSRPKTPQSKYSFDVLNLLDDEVDEFDYEIVNIPPELMRKNKKKLKERNPFTITSIWIRILEREVLSVFTALFPVITEPAKPPQPARYIGQPNAFILELFAMHQDYDERFGFEMLEAAFVLFPNRDYCIISLPSSNISFPLLGHFTLVSPYSFRMRFINETLFVAHINSIRGDVRVRIAEPYDLPNINEILENCPRKPEVLDMLEESFAMPTLSSFVLLSENQPIGLVVVGPLDDGTIIRAQYVLKSEPHRFGTDAAILAGIMSPIMEPHGRWYLRDILRRTRYACLFWACRLFAKGDMPRRYFPNTRGIKALEEIFKEIDPPFALWTIERPMTSLPKIYVNNSIVIVGASRTGLAFLESLFMGPTSYYLTFTNVTLVSDHGLPTVPDGLRAAQTCVPKDGRFTDRYLKSVPFYFYVDVITAILVKIDRKKKCIYFDNGGIKFYDELVLTCGHQFQHPDYLKESLELPDRVPPPPELPANVMLINSLFQANTCLQNLLSMIKEASIVGTRNITQDDRVDQRVQLNLERLGVQVYRKSYLYGWWQKLDIVENLRLMSSERALHMPCFALFYYGLNAIDIYAFKAIIESGLVYDGGVVVGPAFDTNDPHVFAAGPCVRFSRKLYAPDRQHKYYCSEEVGEAQ
ncbi:unnamed protein product [Leptidea sinapis]|uniref:Cilia- and flagella-associated protein 61 N-terminal domain-containing protein n=1 Tax=Leptidea sinapis TaxID=189913 RepID=A0A5E4R6S5_9NEOP|nr:unnamed protein product [Leptidea sinapis]